MATWGRLIIGQLEHFWSDYLRPRVDNLTDDEYFWEPVAGSWNLRPVGNGTFVLDDEVPRPDPMPFSTIAWRMNYISHMCFAERAQQFFNIPANDPMPGTADGGIALLDDTYHRWRDHIAGLDEAAIETPLGLDAGRFRHEPMGALILYTNRQVMHHGAEICLLRDLYRDRDKTP